MSIYPSPEFGALSSLGQQLKRNTLESLCIGFYLLVGKKGVFIHILFLKKIRNAVLVILYMNTKHEWGTPGAGCIKLLNSG